MSTWISEHAWRSAAGVSLAVILAGCMNGGGTGAFSYTRMAPQSVTVADHVVVTAPDGYCVDARATRKAFVLLASCASVTRKANAPQPFAPALLTVTVTPQGDGEPPIARQTASLKRFFGSDAGRAALARDGQAGSVDVIETTTRNGAFIIHLRDRSKNTAPGLSDQEWRAIFTVNGQMVAASVAGLAERSITSDAGLATAIDLATTIINQSRSAAEGAAN